MALAAPRLAGPPPAGQGTVYAVDFGGPGGEHSFHALTAARPELGIVRLTPPGMGATDLLPPDADAYARHYARQIAESGRPVRAVLGFCAGGIHAQTTAGRLRAQGRDVPVVVMLDTVPEGGDLPYEFERTITELGWSADRFDCDLDAAAARVRALWQADGPAPTVAFAEQFADRFIAEYLAARGVPDGHRAELAATMHRRCSAWFRYVAASAGSREQPPGPRIVCSSSDMAPIMRRAWQGSGSEVRVVDAAHHGLLASPQCHAFLVSAFGS